MSYDKRPIIEKAIESREEEIALYEINIDAYERSLAIIDQENSPNLVGDHRDRISGLLDTERRECEKSRLSLRVLQDQLASIA